MKTTRSLIRKLIKEELEKSKDSLSSEELALQGKNPKGIYVLPGHRDRLTTQEQFKVAGTRGRLTKVVDSEKYLLSHLPKTTAGESAIYVDPYHVKETFMNNSYFKALETHYNNMPLPKMWELQSIGINWVTNRESDYETTQDTADRGGLPPMYHSAIIELSNGEIMGDIEDMVERYAKNDVVIARPLSYSMCIYFLIKRYDDLMKNIETIIKKHMSNMPPSHIKNEINKSLEYYEKTNIDQLSGLGVQIEAYRNNINKGDYVKVLKIGGGVKQDTRSKNEKN